MSLTIAQLKNLSFGYLNGADLLRYCKEQLLISQYVTDSDSLQSGCTIAYDEITGKLSTRYGLDDELAKKGFTNASATASLTADAVSGVTIDYAGTNYGTAPVISFAGGGGTGAAATATVANGIVTAINITNGGSGYTSAPAVSIVGGVAADTRAMLIVKIAAIFAVRNILGNAQSIAEPMMNHFIWADKTILELRNAQNSAPKVAEADNSTVGSPATLISSSFDYIG